MNGIDTEVNSVLHSRIHLSFRNVIKAYQLCIVGLLFVFSFCIVM